MATIRQLSKLIINDILRKANLITWRTFSPNYQMHGLVIIACNKLNPLNPWRAYRYLRAEMIRYTNDSERKTGKNESTQQKRLGAIKRELAMITNDETCPCCSRSWDTSDIIPDTIPE